MTTVALGPLKLLGIEEPCTVYLLRFWNIIMNGVSLWILREIIRIKQNVCSVYSIALH